jgi:hypothetical protein
VQAGANDVAPDAAEAINRNFDCHSGCLLSFLGFEIRRTGPGTAPTRVVNLQ